MSVLLQPFAVECVHEGYFEFGRKRIKCNVLEQLDLSSVENGYLYAFHAPEIDIESAGSVLEQYYMEAFQVACMDVIRGWLQGYLERKNSVYENRYCAHHSVPDITEWVWIPYMSCLDLWMHHR